MQLARKECNQTTRVHGVWLPRASFTCIVDKNGTQYSLIPLMESKEGFDYTIPNFSVIIYRGRSEFVSSRFFSTMVYSAAVTDGFIRDTEEVNARISPTRIAIGSSAQQTLTGQRPLSQSVVLPC